jgi:hypothetical protein
LSDPANEPATVAVPPLAGRLKPTWPALSGTIEYPEKLATLAWIELGLHVMATGTGLDASRPVHELAALWIVAAARPPATCAALDPVVVQPEAVSEICVVSGLVPPLVSAGLKFTTPTTLVHVTLPVATAPPPWVVGVTAPPAEVVVVDEVVVAALELEFDEQADRVTASVNGSTSATALQARQRVRGVMRSKY